MFDLFSERLHETGGFYARNITTRNYAPGSAIDVVIDLVANHGGKFVFEMCWRDSFKQKGKQLNCLDNSKTDGINFVLTLG